MSKAASGRLILVPSVNENTRIVAAAKADPDAKLLTKSQLGQMVPLKAICGDPNPIFLHIQRVAMPDPVLELAWRGRALPPEERVRLLDLLLESLQQAAPSDVQEAWNKEIERRVAAHERDEGKVYDLDEVMYEAKRLAS